MTPDAVTLDSLLAHRGWAKRMALRLVHEEDEAEELLQRTWIAALRRPPDRPGGTRAWIAKVLLNLAREQHRRTQTRRRHEGASAAAAETIAPDVSETASRRESCRLLGEALLELEEPYRTTLVLRYFEELNSVEIGRRLGVPQGTVRWRIKVALERLRGELDQRFDGKRTRWVTALAPLLPAGLSPTAGDSAPAGPDAAPPDVPAGAGTASWLMPAGWVTAAAGVAVTAILVLGADGARGSSTESTVLAAEKAESRAASDTADLAGSRQDAFAVAPGPAAVETTTSAAPPSGLRVEVVDREGAAVPGARVHVARAEGLDARATTDEEGVAHLDLGPEDVGALGLPLASGRVSLQAYADGLAASGLVHVEPPFVPEHTVRIFLNGREQVWRGRVVGPDGAPRAGAVVAWFSRGARMPADTRGDFVTPGNVRTRTDAEGRFVLRNVPLPSGTLFCFAEGHPVERWNPEQGSTDDALITLGPGASVEGRVTMAGRPAAGMRVVAEPPLKAAEECAGMPRYDPVLRGFSEIVTTDADGRFVLTGIQAGARILTVVDEATGSVAQSVLQLAPGERAHWSAELTPRTGLRLRLVDEANRPLVGWVAHARRPDGFGSWWLRRQATDEEGRLHILECPEQGAFIDVFDPSGIGASHLSTRLGPSAEEHVLRIDRRASCTVSGILTDALGAPELGGQLQFHSRRTTLKQAVVRDERGAFEQRLPEGPHDLVLVTADSATFLGRVKLEPGEVLDLGLLTTPPKATLRLDGSALRNGVEREPSYSLQAHIGGGLLPVSRGKLDGELVLEVYAGEYRVLAFDGDGGRPTQHEVLVEAAGETRVRL